ncbi:hypothetical protein IW261DRAFT_1596624 [Armillaria novae-zelandiae]|uniref:Heterokaryon incompatibility domain-containing protein n=1 Tax=Armillaria novae-zelandiae TaxID=153914 RepID=A0AA39UBV2_9AGAR|nr:hypothetical protein IW261DRAFT_1596624 [Armillaria novae-zelandiae]
MRLKYASLPKVTLSAFTETGLLEKLNTILGTSYTLEIPSLSSLLDAYILKDYDFGTVFSRLRPFCYNDFTDIQDQLQSCEVWDRQMRQDVLVNNKIVSRLLPPRRVWDLYSNRVTPWWVARQYPSAISHAWMEKEDRMDVQTPINGYEWPVPLPKDANLNLICIEMLNLGAEYVWLDVLCLRQVSEQSDDLHLDEWKLDVPTIGRVYRMAHGRLTLQEIQHRMIIGGEVGDDNIMEKEMQARIENQLSWLRENSRVGGLGMPVFIALSEMQKRVSTNPVDKVAGLSYLLWTAEIPTYYASQSQEEAWKALADEMNMAYRGYMFFLYPKAGNGKKRWRPSWKQAMTEALPPPQLTNGWAGFVLRTKDNDADWCDGPCIESAYVRGFGDESPEEKRRLGELLVEDTMGGKYTFKVFAAHKYLIPEGLYTLVGSSPCDFQGKLQEQQCWVVGERLPGGMFKKVSVFMMANKNEVKRLHE